MNIPEFDEIIEPNDQTEARREHLEKLRQLVGNVYPNKFERQVSKDSQVVISNEEATITRVKEFATPIKDKHIPHLAENEKPSDEQRDAANIELNSVRVRVAGRLAVPPRVMGKAAFVHLSDGIERLQIYVRKQDAKAINNDTGKIIDEEGKAWEIFNLLDHGDFIGVEGYLFVTKTGELSVHVETIQFLAKSMLPMPDKMHGISDPELQRRFRYADLIASSLQVEHEGLTTREVFQRRAKLISGMRRFLDDNGFVEVETPILTPKATGAAAEPFETYHNALDIKLYARIAPELYLKRLMVGGFEKVYELNRNFRNEGLSHKHSPEFTMLEFYCAYMDVNGMMDFAEAMIQESVQKAAGSLQVNYTNLSPISRFDKQLERPITIDFSKFERVTMRQSIVNMLPDFIKELIGNSPESWLEEYKNIKVLHYYWYWLQNEHLNSFVIVANADKIFKRSSQKFSYEGEEREILRNKWEEINNQYENKIFSEAENAKTLLEIFESYVEENLLQPTFIIDYPKVISPLSKASPENPNVAERFELFINGMECANGFSELNDPQEQYERFRDQMKERETGDDEAMIMDEDYIRALSYGMPPAAGIGIGIDRLVMLLTNRHSIRDVILFPHMRPERRDEEKERIEEDDNPSG